MGQAQTAGLYFVLMHAVRFFVYVNTAYINTGIHTFTHSRVGHKVFYSPYSKYELPICTKSQQENRKIFLTIKTHTHKSQII